MRTCFRSGLAHSKCYINVHLSHLLLSLLPFDRVSPGAVWRTDRQGSGEGIGETLKKAFGLIQPGGGDCGMWTDSREPGEEVAICLERGISRICSARDGSSQGHLQHLGFWLEVPSGCGVPRKGSDSAADPW